MNDLGFIGGNLDRAAALRLDDAWLEKLTIDPASRFVKFYGDRPVIDVTGSTPKFHRFALDECSDVIVGSAPVLLGLNEANFALFAVRAPNEPEPQLQDSHLKLIDLRSLALQGCLPAGELGMLAQARSLLFWHERHGYCANCGALTTMAEGGYRRHCDGCNADHFPRTDPVVIIVVTHKNKCLLGRGPQFAEGVYSALAGFMEPGETIEDAARREIFEEVSVHVGKIDYVLSQPWPFPSSLMIGLIGEATDTEITIDQAEIEDARWFDVKDLEAMLADTHPGNIRTPPVMAIAHHLTLEALERIKRA